MRNRELVMLAKDYIDGMSIGGWYYSEKLDGMRALWVPSTRNKVKEDVPFANNNDRFVRCTGLWSRYGNIIPAPDSFLDKLPNLLLDGELYLGRNRFQELMGITRAFVNPKSWDSVKYCIFDSPNKNELLKEGKINNLNFKKVLTGFDNLPDDYLTSNWFDARYRGLVHRLISNDTIIIHNQVKLPLRDVDANRIMIGELDRVCALGAEGLILRHEASIWEPKRSNMMLKVKQLLDSEATVRGYIPGEGRLAGMVGSLIMDWNGLVFNLSGFTDDERRNAKELFPIGTVITFKYRELTDGGIPKEARYWRLRNKE